MDKRQIKTLEEIHHAFSKLIADKSYNDITIQDIIDEAKISRSTFYSHFKTKDDLLSYISKSIFNHVFSHTLHEEESHDFSKSSLFDYTHLITHILYHLYDEKDLVKGILSSQSKEIFLKDFRGPLMDFAESSLKNNFIPSKNIPEDMHAHIIVDSFINLVCYWIDDGCKDSPEKLTEYCLELIK